jgi:AraC-like DNA-binding protein
LTRAQDVPEQEGLPASNVLHLVELTKRWGVSERQLFWGIDLRPRDLADPYLRVPISTGIALTERARALTGEPALGMYLGLQMSISAHGYLGFAAMSAATLRDALSLAIQYTPTRTTALALHLEVVGRHAALVVDERADLGSTRDIVLLGLLVGIWQIGNALLGRQVTESTVRVMFSEPAYYARFRHVPPRVLFLQPANQLTFDTSLLDAPLVSSDPASLRLARDQCERLLDSSASSSRLIERVRRLVLRSDAGVRSFVELAAAVHVSARTLRRRLASEGVSFSALLEEARRDKALLLLRSPRLSIKDVAERLGYANVANFMRAFRRWTGQTPAAYRRDRATP